MTSTELEEENAELKQQLAAFHAAMEREKKPDWQKWLKDLADGLDRYALRNQKALLHDHQEMFGHAARQLRYMADSFTLKANFVPSELKIKELEQQLETANLCIKGLEGNLAAAEKEHERLEADAAAMRKALLKWKAYFQADIPTNADQQEEQGEQFTQAWFDAEQAISPTAGRSLLERLERYEKALERLAKLGNEPLDGNSIGNCIAREALKGGDSSTQPPTPPSESHPPQT